MCYIIRDKLTLPRCTERDYKNANNTLEGTVIIITISVIITLRAKPIQEQIDQQSRGLPTPKSTEVYRICSAGITERANTIQMRKRYWFAVPGLLTFG